ncbi:MAG TPA: hypothetical protein ENI23_16925 [bacterium]|nr:hypothetical protein [bacterium]
MDYVEGRGVTSGNDVYFIFDRENDVVVMATYRDAPGVRSDLLQPNLTKTFSVDEWVAINRFLSVGRDDYDEDEDKEKGDDEDEEKRGLAKLEEMEVDKAFAPKVMDLPSTANIATKDIMLPKMNNAKAILPENSVPAMTKDEVQEKFDPITGTQNEEKGDEELADATIREEEGSDGQK